MTLMVRAFRAASAAALLSSASMALAQVPAPAPAAAQPAVPAGAGRAGAGPRSPENAQTLAASLASLDPIQLVGMTLSDAFASVGVPEEVFPYRGAEASQDDVVFYYPGSVYLFWYRNRVWQVRVDSRFSGLFLGLRMGDPKEGVVERVGRQYQEVEGSLVFFLPDASLVEGADGRAKGTYPLRLRAFFRDGKLSDVYLYRGDF